MAVQFWYLGGGRWSLYTSDESIRDLAEKAGLKLIGTYYRRNGDEFAWQFSGDKRTVMGLAKLGYGGSGAPGLRDKDRSG